MFERKRIQILTNTLKHLMFKSNIHINRLIKKIKSYIRQTLLRKARLSCTHAGMHARTYTPLYISVGARQRNVPLGFSWLGVDSMGRLREVSVLQLCGPFCVE